MVFYTVRDLFRRLPCASHFKPAIGGLGVGLAALLIPQLPGGGYGWIQAAIDGRPTGTLLLFLCFGRYSHLRSPSGPADLGALLRPVSLPAPCWVDF
jgi:CIC family chloride channel protein